MESDFYQILSFSTLWLQSGQKSGIRVVKGILTHRLGLFNACLFG